MPLTSIDYAALPEVDMTLVFTDANPHVEGSRAALVLDKVREARTAAQARKVVEVARQHLGWDLRLYAGAVLR